MEFKNDKEQAVEINFQNFATEPDRATFHRTAQSNPPDTRIANPWAHLLRFHCYRLALSW
ncbi:MAG TPA: hypothetical protein VGW77_16220 [Candidatus Binatia bacterium]|jgi:hypothetical protein|nr:hypothetical protein [Candidatus Binatia bacterium]